MEDLVGCKRREDCDRQSRACALRTCGGGCVAKRGNLRIRQKQVGVRRKYFASSAVCTIRQCAGGDCSDVAGGFAGDARWETLGNSGGNASSDRAGSDCFERRKEQGIGASVSGICEKCGRARDTDEVWFCVSGKDEKRRKEMMHRRQGRGGNTKRRREA